MVIAEIGDVIVVPINVIVQIEGFDNELPTAGKDGTVIETLFDSVDTETGEDLLNYFLRFGETFDLVNVSGTVVSTVNELWFTETDLTQKVTDEPDLPQSTQDINSSISVNKTKLNDDLSSGESILSQIPVNDPIYRGISETIVGVMRDNNTAFAGLRFNPNDPVSVSNITTDVEGSTLVAGDGNVFLSFLDVLKTQQQVVAQKSSTLLKENQQTVSNATKSAESESASTNRFIEALPERTGADTLHLTADTYSPVDWNKIEPTVPTGDSILSEDLSVSQRAAQIFPLLDPSTVVSSGIV